MTKEQLEEILVYSQTHAVPEKEACKILTGYNSKTLFYYKKKYGIQTNPIGMASFTARKLRKYQVNDAYFSTLTLENCYYAGFLAADGCIIKNQLIIGLSETDKRWLENFKESLNAESSVKDRIQKGMYKTCYLNITSDTICNDLLNYFNIQSRKSLSYVPPTNLTDEQKDCFIMGLIDGDGSISFIKTKRTQPRLTISIVGTKDTCMYVKNRFEEILQQKTSNLYQKNSEKNFYSYSISDGKARTLFMYFYTKYKVPKLDRKWAQATYVYCHQYTKKKPICRRKGVNVYTLDGKLLYTCNTLAEASELTGVSAGRISNLCRINDSNHRAGNYMFSRDNVSCLPSYVSHKNSNKINT